MILDRDLIEQLEDDDIEENDVITDDEIAFANDMRAIFQEIIDTECLEEKFVSDNCCNRHFDEHCLGNSKDRKSIPSNIYYDFRNVTEFSDYEERMLNLLDRVTTPTIHSLFDADEIESQFRKFFEGNKFLILGVNCGFKSKKDSVAIGLHSFANDVTSNYLRGNTIDFFILSRKFNTITMIPIEASKLENKLNSCIKLHSNYPNHSIGLNSKNKHNDYL